MILDKDQERKIVEMYQSGNSYKSISNELHIGPAIIKKALSDNNVKIKGRCDYSPVYGKEKEISEFYLSGASYKDIEMKYGITSCTIKRILVLNGIDSRSKNRSKIRKRVDLAGRVEMYFNLNRSLSFISKKCGCSRDAVMQFLRIKGYSESQISRGLNNSFRSISGDEVVMKSPYEVEFAKYLDEYKIKWEYESIKMEQNGMKYTPDFILFDQDDIIKYVVDVKGVSAHYGSRVERKKRLSFKEKTVDRSEFFLQKYSAQFVLVHPTSLKLVVEGIHFNLRRENKWLEQ